MTSSFQPINEAHAITEMAVFIQVEPNMDKAVLEKFETFYNEFQKELPDKRELKTIEGQMAVGDDGPKGEFKETKIGFELRSFGLNGSVSWLVRVSNNTISIHCLDYLRWEPFLERTSKYLKKAFEILNGQGIGMSVVGLKCTDVFTYNGSDVAYDAKEMFRDDCPYIASKLLSSGELWHNHTGWFVEANDVISDIDKADCVILNQIKVDSAYNTVKGKRTLTAKIDHNQIYQTNDENSLIDSSNAFDVSWVELLLNGLHVENKNVLQNLLVDEMQERINLRGGNSEE